MATVHFVKEGKKASGERITRSADVSLDIAIEYLKRFETRHSDMPPTINPDVAASDFAPYRYVVLEVNDGEVTSSFPQKGYYYIVGADPTECQRALGLSGTLV